MTIPNLPTDNLYKFTFLGGLTLVIASCILFVTQYNLLSDKIDINETSIRELETESNFLKEDLKFINKEFSKLEKELSREDSTDIVAKLEALRYKLEKNKNFREYYSFLLDHKEDLIPHYKNVAQIGIMINQIDSLNRKSIANTIILNEKIKLSQKGFRNLILLLIICCILVGIGGSMAVNGYKNWLTLVQQPANEKIKLELRHLKESFEKESN